MNQTERTTALTLVFIALAGTVAAAVVFVWLARQLFGPLPPYLPVVVTLLYAVPLGIALGRNYRKVSEEVTFLGRFYFVTFAALFIAYAILHAAHRL